MYRLLMRLELLALFFVIARHQIFLDSYKPGSVAVHAAPPAIPNELRCADASLHPVTDDYGELNVLCQPSNDHKDCEAPHPGSKCVPARAPNPNTPSPFHICCYQPPGVPVNAQSGDSPAPKSESASRPTPDSEGPEEDEAEEGPGQGPGPIAGGYNPRGHSPFVEHLGDNGAQPVPVGVDPQADFNLPANVNFDLAVDPDAAEPEKSSESGNDDSSDESMPSLDLLNSAAQIGKDPSTGQTNINIAELANRNVDGGNGNSASSPNLNADDSDSWADDEPPTDNDSPIPSPSLANPAGLGLPGTGDLKVIDGTVMGADPKDGDSSDSSDVTSEQPFPDIPIPTKPKGGKAGGDSDEATEAKPGPWMINLDPKLSLRGARLSSLGSDNDKNPSYGADSPLPSQPPVPKLKLFDPNNPAHIITQAMRLLHQREHAAMDSRHKWEHGQLAAHQANELNSVQAQLQAEANGGGAFVPPFVGALLGGPKGQAGPPPQFPPLPSPFGIGPGPAMPAPHGVVGNPPFQGSGPSVAGVAPIAGSS